jgi:WD40-like Beta Propeller Repeat
MRSLAALAPAAWARVNGRPVYMVCDLPDCTNPREFAGRAGQWTPDGRGIAFSRFTDKTIKDFSWSPDGKRLGITRGTALADMVLIKGIR